MEYEDILPKDFESVFTLVTLICFLLITYSMTNFDVSDTTNCLELLDYEKSFTDLALIPSYGYLDPNGPDKWKDKFLNCNGVQQSPINIIIDSVLVIQDCKQLSWSKEYSEIPDFAEISNDGHTVVFNIIWKDGRSVTLTNGPLGNSVYKLKHIKFRWGADNGNGSEHRLNNNSYSMEMQILFKKLSNNKTDNEIDEMNDSNLSKNCLAIVSVLLKSRKWKNSYLDPIIKNLRKIKNPDTSTFIQPFPLSWIVPLCKTSFYSYQGSLTYPPCIEGILWIVMPKPINISSKQIQKFRKIHGFDGPIIENCRPCQKLNDREIFYFEC